MIWKLRHYSNAPIKDGLIVQRAYYDHQGITTKPPGFWMSVEARKLMGSPLSKEYRNWKEWCEENGNFFGALEYVYSVNLQETADMLWLNTLKEMYEFTERYGTPKAIPGVDERDMEPTPGYIDWKQVAEKWHGIIIAPYFHTPILDPKFTWYYGWSCASAAIWDTGNAIKSINLENEQDN